MRPLHIPLAPGLPDDGAAGQWLGRDALCAVYVLRWLPEKQCWGELGFRGRTLSSSATAKEAGNGSGAASVARYRLLARIAASRTHLKRAIDLIPANSGPMHAGGRTGLRGVFPIIKGQHKSVIRSRALGRVSALITRRRARKIRRLNLPGETRNGSQNSAKDFHDIAPPTISQEGHRICHLSTFAQEVKCVTAEAS